MEENEERKIGRNMLLCRTGTIFTTHLDQIAMRSIRTAMRRSEKSESGRTDSMPTEWPESHQLIGIVILKRIIDHVWAVCISSQ